jgi:hypothetical protein
VQEETFLVDEQLDAAQAISYADLRDHMRRLPSTATAVAGESSTGRSSFTVTEEGGSSSSSSNKMYVHGHMDPEGAQALFSRVLPLLASPPDRSCYAPSGATLLPRADMSLLFPPFNPSDGNSALVSHFQVSEGADLPCFSRGRYS